MSLLLTSQSNVVNSRPFDYQNYFSNTFKIPKDSLIALNHVTINRNAFFNFDEEKVLSFYHGVEMPSNKQIVMNSYFEDSNGKAYTLLRGETDTTLNSREINNFVNFPMLVMIDKGEYSIEQLCLTLQYRLNNPTAEYGGDYHVTGEWKVTPNYDANNQFTHISFEWSTEVRQAVPAFPLASDFKTKFTDDTNIVYAQKGADYEIKGGAGNTDSAVGEFYRFLSHEGGSIKFSGVDTNGDIVGLTRVTNGRDYMTAGTIFNGETLYDSSGQISNYGSYDNEDSKIVFFDICVAVINNKLTLWYLHTGEDFVSSMKEISYGPPIDIYPSDTDVTFTINGNSIEITLHAYMSDQTITQLLPINNNTYQLIPKVVLIGQSVIQLKSGNEPDLLPSNIVPVVPDKVVNGKTNFSTCNIGWIMENVWNDAFDFSGRDVDDGGLYNSTKGYLNNNYLITNRNKFKRWQPEDADVDRTLVVLNGQSLTIPQMKIAKYWWSYDFDPTLNTNAGGFKYHWMPYDSSKYYIYDIKGHVIIPYDTIHLHYHCGGTLDGAVGILPRFKKGVEGVTDPVVEIVGTDRIALTNNDLLYIRIDLGNVYSVNGHTSSVSKIISPIITDTNSTSDQGLGIRTFNPPERMYVKLNNSEDLYINSINVSIVNKNEEFARDLAPTTSASFHIKENK